MEIDMKTERAEQQSSFAGVGGRPGMRQVRESFELHRSCGFRMVVRQQPGHTGHSELLNIHHTLVVGQAQSWCW